jgi:S-DNA-T family DNA segregation ATPase FtsK/SpoIIIE
MGKKKKKKVNPLESLPIPEMGISQEVKKSILIIFILIMAALSLLGLFGQAGAFGSLLARGQTLVFGWGKWLFPVLLFSWAFILYRKDKTYIRGAGILGMFVALLSIEGLFHFFLPRNEWRSSVDEGVGGGFLGLFMASSFFKILGFWGGLIVLVALLVVAIMLISNGSLMKLFNGGLGVLKPVGKVSKKMVSDDDAGEEVEEVEEIENSENEDIAFAKKTIVEEVGDEEEVEEEEVEAEAAPSKGAVVAKDAKKKTEAEIWKMKNVKIDLPLDLLEVNNSKATAGDIKNNQVIIQRTLENFGIPVEMDETKVGPTVTQYTFKPADGVKLSRITTLNNDLSLALAAHPLRIEAPIPGKALVGIEVPNKTKAMVGLKELLEDKEFHNRKTDLNIALGKDVSGSASFYDITRMPHLLVAGATNSGKSVCLNSIIISLLYQNNPENLRFIMVDPKRVELTVYDGIPHLMTPVITKVDKTINALRWCLNEMDRRFDVLQNFKKRNIQEYNKSSKDKMPYIVFIVDELADLMVTAGRDIETSIIRLAQMARAVGIHLILATQRPSVDVITGLIKANMPTRIAFSVASGVDSKTILDSLGAEKLLGKGDMLFQTPEIAKPRRLQGAFVSDNEIHRIVSCIKEKAGLFEYVDGITDPQRVRGVAGVGMEGGEEQGDDLAIEAANIIVESGKASATFLQRKLSVGYARAAKILDILEEMGVVGPANGAKPREIMLDRGQLDRFLANPAAGAPLHDREETEPQDEYLPGGNSLGEAPGDNATVFKSNTNENEEAEDVKGEEVENNDSNENVLSFNEDENKELDEEEIFDDSEEDSNKKDKKPSKTDFHEEGGMFF